MRHRRSASARFSTQCFVSRTSVGFRRESADTAEPRELSEIVWRLLSPRLFPLSRIHMLETRFPLVIFCLSPFRSLANRSLVCLPVCSRAPAGAAPLERPHSPARPIPSSSSTARRAGKAITSLSGHSACFDVWPSKLKPKSRTNEMNTPVSMRRPTRRQKESD